MTTTTTGTAAGSPGAGAPAAGAPAAAAVPQTFKLDGKELPFQAGDTIIRAAWRQGIEIPHYCWHPGLSIAANCRMCLVEIKAARPMMLPILSWDEKKKEYVDATKPKLQPACQIEVTPGMDVSSTGKQAVEAQAAVQEFLLLNHPVDCPICDQAGECKLQDYWLAHQKKLKRKDTEPVHKPKAVRFGPTIVYDAERCIMCTRCVRFSDEVAKDHVLDMRERGNRNEICLSPGRELDHDYTLMTEHVCPVGALTSKDFRFKARVWFLRSAPGVCNGCATGCNSWIDFDPRTQRVHRLRPRDNEEVNKFWMCDAGMLSYHGETADRVLTGRVRQDGRALEVTRDVAIAAAAKVLKGAQKLAVVLSAQASSEDNVALLKLAKATSPTVSIYLAAKPDWKGDDILRSVDQNPNRAGATSVAGGGTVPGTAALAKAVAAKEVDAILSLGAAAVESSEALAALNDVPHVNLTAHSGALTSTASVVVPVAAITETSGTFVNKQGKAQSFQRAVQPPGHIRSGWETLVAIGTAAQHEIGFAKLAEVRAALPATATAPAGGA